jgi:hypothetical protein
VQRSRKGETLSQALTSHAGATRDHAAELESDEESYQSDIDEQAHLETTPKTHTIRKEPLLFHSTRPPLSTQTVELLEAVLGQRDGKSSGTYVLANTAAEANVIRLTNGSTQFPGPNDHLAVFAAAQVDASADLDKEYDTTGNKADFTDTIKFLNASAKGKPYSELTLSSEKSHSLTGEQSMTAIDSTIAYTMNTNSNLSAEKINYLRHMQNARKVILATGKGMHALDYELAVRNGLMRDPTGDLADYKSVTSVSYREIYITEPEKQHEDRLKSAAKRKAASATHVAASRAAAPHAAAPHVTLQAPKAMKKPSVPPCRDFNAGKCTRGADCRFNHICSHAKCLPKSYPHALKVCRNAAVPADG